MRDSSKLFYSAGLFENAEILGNILHAFRKSPPLYLYSVLSILSRLLHVDDSNIFDWQIAIFGPPGTTYGGGYFKAHIRFPGDYPFSAPSFRFLTKIWHPNIYENGEVNLLFPFLSVF